MTCLVDSRLFPKNVGSSRFRSGKTFCTFFARYCAHRYSQSGARGSAANVLFFFHRSRASACCASESGGRWDKGNGRTFVPQAGSKKNGMLRRDVPGAGGCTRCRTERYNPLVKRSMMSPTAT